jgi:hypothetical protein
MAKKITRKIEISFWKIAIWSMSKSPLVRSVIRGGSKAAHEFALPDPARTIVLVSLSGLASGSLLAYLIYIVH